MKGAFPTTHGTAALAGVRGPRHAVTLIQRAPLIDGNARADQGLTVLEGEFAAMLECHNEEKHRPARHRGSVDRDLRQGSLPQSQH
jgi:hypothetical protein